MLSRQELVRDMRSQHKGASWVCIQEVKRYFGFSDHTVREFLSGLDCYRKGQKKLYHVIDIAKQVEKFKDAG